MKHIKSYNGPDGVFYDKKHDEIFVLAFTGRERLAMGSYEKLGKIYKMYDKDTNGRLTAISGMEFCERIGEL